MINLFFLKSSIQQQAKPTNDKQYIKYNPKLTQFGCDVNNRIQKQMADRTIEYKNK